MTEHLHVGHVCVYCGKHDTDTRPGDHCEERQLWVIRTEQERGDSWNS